LTDATTGPAPGRWRWSDVAVSVGLAFVMILGTFGASHRQPGAHRFDAVGVLLVLLAAGVIAWRRFHPVAVLEAAFAITLVYFLLGYANGPIWLALVVSYIGAVMRGHRTVAVVTATVGFVIFPWLDYALGNGPAPTLSSLLTLAAWLLVLLGAGEIMRIRRERAVEATLIAEEERRRRASEERLRIARELHDALGHHLSLINVQSGVALHVNEDLPEQARSSLEAIKRSSKDALTELRSVLEILRQDGESAPRSPTSTLERIGDLVSRSSAAGLEVRVDAVGAPRMLPFSVDVAAFRIVQEALTNVSRHSTSRAATVRITYGERTLVMEIEDDGPSSTSDGQTGGGRGIQGMRERLAALGGTLDAGPRENGGFRVRAKIPLEGAS
jgi:signal transduction histidine kinase